MNLVLIVLDTARADRILDEDGNVCVENLGRLARDGVVFPHCYSHASMTLPAHVSLFTSRFPYETGVLTNESRLPPDLPDLTAVLHEEGYATAAFSSIGALRPDNLLGAFDLAETGDWGLTFAERAEPLAEAALDFLGEQRPVFLFAHYSDPHYPYRAHGLAARQAEVLVDGELQATLSTSMAEFWQAELELGPGRHRVEVRSEDLFRVRDFTLRVGRFYREWDFEEGSTAMPLKRAVIRLENPSQLTLKAHVGLYLEDLALPENLLERYAREVEHADQYIGRLLDRLEERGLYDSSLIVFTSDHGEGLGDHDFNVHAENVYDEQLHVPLIVKPPAGFDLEPLRRQRARLVRHVDVTATILEILGLDPLPGQKGVALLEDGERLLVAQTHKPISSKDLLALRDERFKLIYDVDADAFEMYDIQADPPESRNVFAELGDQRQEWPALLRWMAGEALASPQAEVDDDLRHLLDNLGY